MTIITCSSCGFTSHSDMFAVLSVNGVTEAECSECGNWTTLDWDTAVSLFN